MSTQASADTVLRLPLQRTFPRAGSAVLRSRQSGEIVAPARAHLSVVSGALVDRRRLFFHAGYQPESPCSPPARWPCLPPGPGCGDLVRAVLSMRQWPNGHTPDRGRSHCWRTCSPAGPARSWFWFCWDLPPPTSSSHDVVGRRRGAHAIANPYLHPFAGDSRMRVTLGLLVLLQSYS